MAQQTQLATAEQLHSHIIEVSQMLCERLEYIKLLPNNILNVSSEAFFLFSSSLLQRLYTEAKIIKTVKQGKTADFIFGVLCLDSNKFCEQFPLLLSAWKDNLSSGGLLVLGVLNPAAEMVEIGDCLVALGYKNVVIDKESLSDGNCVVCVHAWKAASVSVPLNQVQRL